MTKDLTTGNEIKVIISFAIPLMIGNIFQQLYNLADTIIVGRYIGPNALAAVGSSFSIMIFLTSVIIGLCMGASVLFSQLFGAKEEADLKNIIVTAFLFIGILTVIINIMAIGFTEEILRFMNIPDYLMEQTKTYITIIFYGMIFTFIYNYFCSLLRAIGNSATPLYFLIAAAIVNIVLDIVFITVFDMGVAGAAYATIIAQAGAGIGIAIYCFKKLPLLKFKLSEWRINWRLLKQVANYSILTSVQQSIMNFGILMIQGLVNSFGVAVMAAFAAAVKIDSFAYMPVQDFGNAFATYIAQNKGAGKIDRIKSGTKAAVKMITLFCIIISVSVIVFSRQLMMIFVNGKEVEIINYGVEYLCVVGIFYCFIGYLFMFYGFYRGYGQSGMSIILTIISLGLRVALAYTFVPMFGVGAIWWAIPIGWIIADGIGLIRLRSIYKGLGEVGECTKY